MKKSTWTLFGISYFINDIIDAIEAQNGKVTHIVLNQKIDEKRMSLLPKDITIQKINSFKPQSSHYFFGFVDGNKNQFLESLKKHEIVFSNIIHPRSYVAKNILLGQGNFIGAGSVIGPLVKMGDFNIINRLVSIGHHVLIGHYNHIGPGATISGKCRIGNKNFFGAGSISSDGITVKDNIIVGAGGVVIRDLIQRGTYAGVPVTILHK
jgi:sugar O-acyltransferase (sialic acid O-acetyltransferase NeuD family)